MITTRILVLCDVTFDDEGNVDSIQPEAQFVHKLHAELLDNGGVQVSSRQLEPSIQRRGVMGGHS